LTVVGENLRRLRVAFGHSQQSLADKAGITQPAISNIEAGKTYPHFDTVRRLAGALGVPMTAIIDEAPSGPPPPPKTPLTDEPDTKFTVRFGRLSAVEAWEQKAELDAELTELQDYIRGLRAAGVGEEEFTFKRARGKLARCVRRLSAVTTLATDLDFGREPKGFDEYAAAPDELERFLSEEEARRAGPGGAQQAG
jgi:transcriptional regulator with XRE-family HTH domain